MRELGYIDGAGTLGGEAVTYSIRVVYDGSLIHGHGLLLGADMAALAAFQAGTSALTLETGEEIRVIVTGFSRGNPSPFETMGVLPGPWAGMIGE